MYNYTVGDTVELYERNYWRFVELVPQLPRLRGSVSFRVGEHQELCLEVLETGPYTTTVALHYRLAGGQAWVIDPHMTVRLYHDARVAEVVACQKFHHFRSTYPYPNPNMFARREKRQLNVFLAEWLSHCAEQGLRLLSHSDLTKVD